MKEKILENARFLFVTFGPRRVGIEALALRLGISKKTIYKYFSSKEQLVAYATVLELENTKSKIEEILCRPENPVRKMLTIYYLIVKALQQLNPAFLHEVRAHYPQTFSLIEDFRVYLIEKSMALLKEAKLAGMIDPHIEEELFVRIHLTKIDQIVTENKLYYQAEYSTDTLFEYLILNNVKGVLLEEYRSSAFNKI